MVISAIPDSTNVLSDNAISLGFGNYMETTLQYGAQPPGLNQPQSLHLAMDDFDLQRGPAWLLQTLYDKLVIVPENSLTVPSTKRGVNWPPYNPSDPTAEFQRKGVVHPGDRPWFCYWNSTLLEIFIYINQTSVAGSHLSSSSSSAATTQSSSANPPAATNSGANTAFSSLPSYPKVMKVEERRISSSSPDSQPYCVQHLINDEGIAVPWNDGNGQPITIHLVESEPTALPPLISRNVESDGIEERNGNLEERQQSISSCDCGWLLL